MISEQITILNETTLESLNEADDIKIVATFTKVGLKLLEADFGFVWLNSIDSKDLKLVYKSPKIPYSPQKPKAGGRNYKVLESSHPDFVKHVKKRNDKYDVSRYMKSFVIIPLVYKKIVYGNMVLCFKKVEIFPKDKRTICSFIGNSVAQTITINRLIASERDARLVSEIQKTQFKALVENSFEMIIHIHKDGEILYVSPSVKKILGVNEEDFIGKDIGRLIYNIHDPKASRKYIRNVLKNSKINYTAEFCYENKSGSSKLLESISSTMKGKDDIEGIVINIRDISERRKSENEILRAKNIAQTAKENLYRLFMNAPAIVAVITGPDLVFEMANHSYRQLFKIERELVGIPLKVALPSLEPAMLNILHNVATKGERFAANEIPISIDWDNNGIVVTKYFDLVYEPIVDENKKSNGVMCFAYDISEQVHNRKKLEEAARSKDEFIGIAGHELKTPVTSIKAYTQILEARFRNAGDTQSANMTGKMNAQLDKLTGLITDLLDVTKIDAGKLQFNGTCFDLNKFIDEIVEETQLTTTDHKIIKKLQPTETVCGDRDRIGQVLTNFLTNAIKYSPPLDIDRNVDTKKSHPTRGKIIVSTIINTRNITLCVRDFGIGLSKEDQKKIFERFYRVGGRGHDTYPGLGLGLYISSEIIKRQNGKIWVKSKKGEGSVFCFSLPIAKKKNKFKRVARKQRIPANKRSIRSK